MERYFDVFAKMAFILLAVWVVLAGLGMTTMPGTVKKAIGNRGRRRVKGQVWAVPVVAAPMSEDNLAFPQTNVM